MSDAEGVPENDVGVINGGVAVGDPFGNAAGGFTGGLGDVAAGGEDLIVVVWRIVSHGLGKGEGRNLHFVTWTAWRAKPARFHTREPSFGRSLGTSLLTSL